MSYQYLDENESHFRTCQLRHDVSYTCVHSGKKWTQCSVFELKKTYHTACNFKMELGGNLTFSVVKRYQLRARLYDTYRCNQHPHRCQCVYVHSPPSWLQWQAFLTDEETLQRDIAALLQDDLTLAMLEVFDIPESDPF